MNPADKLQEIADKISTNVNSLADKLEEVAEQVLALSKSIAIIEKELAQAIASIREQLQNPPPNLQNEVKA